MTKNLSKKIILSSIYIFAGNIGSWILLLILVILNYIIKIIPDKGIPLSTVGFVLFVTLTNILPCFISLLIIDKKYKQFSILTKVILSIIQLGLYFFEAYAISQSVLGL